MRSAWKRLYPVSTINAAKEARGPTGKRLGIRLETNETPCDLSTTMYQPLHCQHTQKKKKKGTQMLPPVLHVSVMRVKNEQPLTCTLKEPIWNCSQSAFLLPKPRATNCGVFFCQKSAIGNAVR